MKIVRSVAMITISIVLICVELSWWGLLTPFFIMITFML